MHDTLSPAKRQKTAQRSGPTSRKIAAKRAQAAPASSPASTPPAKPYEATQVERAARARYDERRRTSPELAKFKIKPDDATVMTLDHPDINAAGSRLFSVFATGDINFVDGALLAIVEHARNGRDYDIKAINNAVAIVKEIAPRDPTEALLAMQMAAVHEATMTAAKRLRKAEEMPHAEFALASLNKLARIFTQQMDTLKRWRSDGEQTIQVRYQHVTVHDGGQAIVAGSLQGGAVDEK